MAVALRRGRHSSKEKALGEPGAGKGVCVRSLGLSVYVLGITLVGHLLMWECLILGVKERPGRRLAVIYK